MKGLLKNLIRTESKSFELAEFEFDTNYERIQIKQTPSDQRSLDHFQLHKKASLIRLDEEYVNKFKGYEKLCRDSFLELLRKIKLQKLPGLKVKFLFMDSETSILFRRLITWLELKDADIACQFILNEDQVSNYLTQYGSVFYVVSINYLKKFEKDFTNRELANRKCLRMTVYLRERRNYLNPKQTELIDKLIQLTKTELNFLNIFLPINESVILIHNSTSTLKFLVGLLKSSKTFQESDLPSPFKYKKYSNHLAYLLYKYNLNPSIRYLNNFNESNKMIAESTSKILQKFYGDSNVSSSVLYTVYRLRCIISN